MSNHDLKIQQQSAEKLASGYTWKHRAFEVTNIVLFWAFVSATVWKVIPHFKDSPWLILAAFLTGFIVADWVSGFVHWLADTWGDIDMPVIGKALLRPFREHHVDQRAITRHDYIETNGNNCGISVPWAFGSMITPLDGEHHLLALFIVVSITSMIFWVMMTNQFHKWAHETDEERPRLVTALQRMHLILPPEHHRIHHTRPFMDYYCITTGWLNWPLKKLGYYRTMERIVTTISGVIPRKDDIGLDAALATAPLPEDQREPLEARN
jgi:ubiquitin-conjugating enzyme E2 variant